MDHTTLAVLIAVVGALSVFLIFMGLFYGDKPEVTVVPVAVPATTLNTGDDPVARMTEKVGGPDRVYETPSTQRRWGRFRRPSPGILPTENYEALDGKISKG